MPQKEEWILSLRDQYSQNAKKASKANRAFNKSVNIVKANLKTLAPIAGAAGAALVFRALVKTAADFEKEMSSVRAISQANTLQFMEMRAQAEELGRTTAFSAKQSSEAMSFLAMAGFDVKDIMGALPGTLDLAAAGAIDLGQAADIASNVLTQFGLAATDMGRVNDVIVKTTTRANLNVQQLAEGLKFTGTTAKILKIPLEETAAALGVLGNAGLQGSMGGTSLNFALLEMSRISSPTAQKLKDLGIITHDSNKEFVGLTNILKQFEARGIKSTTILDTFGARGGRAMGTLVEAGSAAVEELTELNKASAGIAKTVAKMKLDNLAGDMTILKSATQGLAISLGKRMNPGMRDTIKLTTKVVNAIEKWVRVPLSEELRKENTSLNTQFAILKNGNIPLDVRREIVNKINVQYKDYLPNLLTEKSSIEDLEIAQAALNKEMLKRIEIQAKQEFLQEKQNKAAALMVKILKESEQLEKLRTRVEQFSQGGVDLAGVGATAADPRFEFAQTEKRIADLTRQYEKATLEAAEFASKLGTGGLLSGASIPEVAATTTVTAQPSRELQQTVTSAAPKVFNINIQKLIETQQINTTTIQESTPQVKQILIEALLEGLNETQTMIAR